MTVTDAQGCTVATNTTVIEPTALNVGVDATVVDCHGNNTGALDITITGGSGSFNYLWSTGETSEDIFLKSLHGYKASSKAAFFFQQRGLEADRCTDLCQN